MGLREFGTGGPWSALGRYMNWDQIEGKWKQLTGSAQERWGKLTNDDVQTLTGQKDHLVGKIQERYGIARAEAEKQADAWSQAQKVNEGRRGRRLAGPKKGKRCFK